jgi:hypothetical protein
MNIFLVDVGLNKNKNLNFLETYEYCLKFDVKDKNFTTFNKYFGLKINKDYES